jgi:hypothetical protein
MAKSVQVMEKEGRETRLITYREGRGGVASITKSLWGLGSTCYVRFNKGVELTFLAHKIVKIT